MKFVHILMALAVAILWGGNIVVTKYALTEWPPFLYLVARTTLTALPIVFFLPRPKVPWTLMIAYGLLVGVSKFSFANLALACGVGAGLASILYQTQVFFTIIFAAIFLQERPKARQNLGMLIAFMGVIFVGFNNTTANPLGFIYMLCSAACWGASNLVMKRAGTVNMLEFVAWTSLIPPLPLMGLSGWAGEWEKIPTLLMDISWMGWMMVLYSALLSGLLGYTLWGMLLRRYPTNQVVTFSLLVPIFGIMWGMIFLDETLSANAFLGGILVLLGLVLNQGNWEKWLKTLEASYPLLFAKLRQSGQRVSQVFSDLGF